MSIENSHPPDVSFFGTQPPRRLLILNALAAIAYFLVILIYSPSGNPYLYGFLIFSEVFHLWILGTFLYTVWDMRYEPHANHAYTPWVDVFITVAGEPEDVVRETVQAAKAMRYPAFHIHILNDGYVARKENWQDIERLAQEEGIFCITRQKPGGAKAGNINNALRNSSAPFVAVFDADHVPHPDFLEKTMGYFADPRMGFVQSPQYYRNSLATDVAGAAWDQQKLFFGPICIGKNRLNSTFMCGTNMVLRREAIMEAGGMCETNIAEDFLTSLYVHERGWKSYYVAEVLAEGLAPEDLLSFSKQQFRWARGSLEIILLKNPLFRRGLSFGQRIQYLASSSYYLSGPVVLLNAVLPLAYFYTGVVPIVTSTMLLAAVFIPYIFITLYTLQLASNSTYTYRALSFSLSSWALFLSATVAVLLRQKTSFSITSKKLVEGNFVRLALPHLVYMTVATGGIFWALHREGLSPAFFANGAWTLVYMSVFWPFVQAAVPMFRPREHARQSKEAVIA